MSTNDYPYTPEQLERVFESLSTTLFNVTRDIGEDDYPAPKILAVVGVPGAGKTWMLNNTLLKQPRYRNFVRLYRDDFRQLHPRYSEFAHLDAASRYAHTESFIWDLCGRVFAYAVANSYNIVMETAMDTPAFAKAIDGLLAAYEFDVHLIGCKKDFVHMSTIRRMLDGMDKGIMDRFVTIEMIDESINNAQAILSAFETACMRVSGSQIRMYERGFGKLRNTTQFCHSRCDRVSTLTPRAFTDENGRVITLQEQTHRIERNELLNQPCTVPSFLSITHAPVAGEAERREAFNEASELLGRLDQYEQRVPASIRDALRYYVEKYRD